MKLTLSMFIIISMSYEIIMIDLNFADRYL